MPVLSVRLELRAREEARLEAERQAALEAEAAAEEERVKGPSVPSYLKPLDKRVRDKTLAEPPPRLLMARKGNSPRSWSAVSRRRAEGGAEGRIRGAASSPRSASTPRGSSSVPGYMQRITRSARGGRRPSARRGRSASPWGPAKKTKGGDVRKRGRSAQRQALAALARGRSSAEAAGGRMIRRSGATTSISLGRRASKGRGSGSIIRRRSVVGRGGDGGKRHGDGSKSKSGRGRRRGSSAASPRRPTWPAMGSIVQVAPPPSRLKLRGKGQPETAV